MQLSTTSAVVFRLVVFDHYARPIAFFLLFAIANAIIIFLGVCLYIFYSPIEFYGSEQLLLCGCHASKEDVHGKSITGKKVLLKQISGRIKI